jgi:hypothetical protein
MKRPTPLESLDDFDWNQWMLSIGMGGWLASEYAHMRRDPHAPAIQVTRDVNPKSGAKPGAKSGANGPE